MRPTQVLTRIEAAWDRLRGRQTRSYDGARFTRLDADWVARTLPTDQELRDDLAKLRWRCRDLAQNNPYAVRFLERLTDDVIGPFGIGMQGQLRGADGELLKDPNMVLERGWSDFSECVTLDRTQGLTDLCQDLIQAVAHDGEIFIRKRIGPQYPFGLALEPIDPDMVDETYSRRRNEWNAKNEIRLSVEVDREGARVGYWVWDGPVDYRRERYFVPASEMIHIGRSRRINQTRYVPWFYPVMGTMKMLEGYVEAELVAARVAAAKSFWFQPRENANVGTKTPGVSEPINMSVEPGTGGVIPKDYEFVGWDPQHPTTAFSSFHAAMIRRIASGLGISYTALANDPGDANYSSSRTAILLERDFYRRIQQRWIRSFMQVIFDEFLRVAPLSGSLDLRGPLAEARRVKWSPRGWDWVDPKSDVEGALLAINGGLDSPQRIVGARGLDFEDDVVEPLKQAKKLLEAAGLRVSFDSPPPGSGAPPTSTSSTKPEGAVSDEADGDASRRGETTGKKNGKPVAEPAMAD